MRFESVRFGEIEVDDDTLVRFERGLPGFADATRFVVMDHDRDTPLKWLQCVDAPELAFLIVEPEQVLGSYQVDVPAGVLEGIGANKDDTHADLALFVILNADEHGLTANLRAPVVVNMRDRRAHQLILDDTALDVRFPIGVGPVE